MRSAAQRRSTRQMCFHLSPNELRQRFACRAITAVEARRDHVWLEKSRPLATPQSTILSPGIQKPTTDQY
jgi:hypothetical protein